MILTEYDRRLRQKEYKEGRVKWKEERTTRTIKKSPSGDLNYYLCLSEATIGFEPMVRVLQTHALSTWPRRHDSQSGKKSGQRDSDS